MLPSHTTGLQSTGVSSKCTVYAWFWMVLKGNLKVVEIGRRLVFVRWAVDKRAQAARAPRAGGASLPPLFCILTGGPPESRTPRVSRFSFQRRTARCRDAAG